jgi:hypothetical protein
VIRDDTREHVHEAWSILVVVDRTDHAAGFDRHSSDPEVEAGHLWDFNTKVDLIEKLDLDSMRLVSDDFAHHSAPSFVATRRIVRPEDGWRLRLRRNASQEKRVSGSR